MLRKTLAKQCAHVRVMSSFAALCLLATACASTDHGHVVTEIDQPAVDRALPPDAVVDVKREFGAVGDGVSDDTTAVQAAISASLGFASKRKELYFPPGTYLVSRPLTWQRANGIWDTWLTLQGANRDRTVIRLAPHAGGFQDAGAPRSVIVTGSQNPYGADGSGNEAFHNFIFDLTVDVGADNPGANGIDYLGNNRGAIRNVVVQAPPGSGNVGISMLRKYPGPAILQNVRVTGFSRGIELDQTEYSIVAEHLRLSGQRQVGVELRSNVLTIRDLVSDNGVSAVKNGAPDAQGGLLTLLDSVLTGGAAESTAIENFGAILLRGVHVGGYGHALQDHGEDRRVDASSEVSYPPVYGVQRPLGITVREEPEIPRYALSDWTGVDQFGAHASDGRDDTGAIQAALDSGKPVVYFHPGIYQVSRTLQVPGTVHVIEGFDAWIMAKSGEMTTGRALFSVAEPSSQPLILTKLYLDVAPAAIDIDRSADRTIFLRDSRVSGHPFRGRPGQVFLTDVVAGVAATWTFTPEQEVWARQLNVEQPDLKILNDGGQLWILGLKSELPSTVLRNVNGARTELLGGLLYAVKPTSDAWPAFVTSGGGSVSLTFATTAYQQSGNYHVLVDRLDASGHQQLTDSDVPRRGLGSIVTLYRSP